jgi:hypothetical protein
MSSHQSGAAAPPAHKKVRINGPPSHRSSVIAAWTAIPGLVDGENETVEPPKEKKKKKDFHLNPQKWNWPPFLSWVPGQLNSHGLKPVIRSSIASWIVISFPPPISVCSVNDNRLVVSIGFLYGHRGSCWASSVFISRCRLHSTSCGPNRFRFHPRLANRSSHVYPVMLQLDFRLYGLVSKRFLPTCGKSVERIYIPRRCHPTTTRVRVRLRK